MCISIVLAITYFLGGETLYQLFFEEDNIVAYGVQIIHVIIVIVLFQVSQVIYMGCLRGAGDVFFTTLASTFSVTIIRPLASYLFCYALGLGLMGIWLGVLGDQISRFVLTNWRFRSGAWTKIKI